MGNKKTFTHALWFVNDKRIDKLAYGSRKGLLRVTKRFPFEDEEPPIGHRRTPNGLDKAYYWSINGFLLMMKSLLLVTEGRLLVTDGSHAGH